MTGSSQRSAFCIRLLMICSHRFILASKLWPDPGSLITSTKCKRKSPILHHLVERFERIPAPKEFPGSRPKPMVKRKLSVLASAEILGQCDPSTERKSRIYLAIRGLATNRAADIKRDCHEQNRVWPHGVERSLLALPTCKRGCGSFLGMKPMTPLAKPQIEGKEAKA